MPAGRNEFDGLGRPSSYSLPARPAEIARIEFAGKAWGIERFVMAGQKG
jgi:hypothetical protein